MSIGGPPIFCSQHFFLTMYCFAFDILVHQILHYLLLLVFHFIALRSCCVLKLEFFSLFYDHDKIMKYSMIQLFIFGCLRIWSHSALH